MKVIFLGTNGWYPTQTGDTPSILIDSQKYYIVFDAGNGIYKLDKYITEHKKPIYLFISHFHLDHTAGLHILAKFRFPQGIDICVGKGRVKDFTTLANAPYTIGYQPKPENISNLSTPIRLHELTNTYATPFPLESIKLHHAYVDHGFKITLENKIISYTGDCGLTDSLRKLAYGADLLISECSNKKTPEPDLWGHLDPYQVANLAKKEKVKQVILTHFGVNNYPTINDRNWAVSQAREIFPHTVAAYDGFVYNL